MTTTTRIANPCLVRLLCVFHILEIIVGLGLAAAAGYVLYKDTENTVGYIVAGVALLFVIVGAVGIASRKLWIPLAVFHMLVQGAFIVLVAAFLSEFSAHVTDDLKGGEASEVKDGLEYLNDFQVWVCVGVGVNLLIEVLVLLFTVVTLRKDRELKVAERRRAVAARIQYANQTPNNV
jgi:hypothetical protein